MLTEKNPGIVSEQRIVQLYEAAEKRKIWITII